MSPQIVASTQNSLVCVHVGAAGAPAPSIPLMEVDETKNTYKLTSTSSKVYIGSQGNT